MLRDAQSSQLETAIQEGNVVLTQTPAKTPGATGDPATLTAWAKRAEYRAADQVLHLTGDPGLNDGQSLQMAAAAIDYHRDSRDATAQGSVKVTYTQQKNASAHASQRANAGRTRAGSRHRRPGTVAPCDQRQRLPRHCDYAGAHVAGRELRPGPGA